MATHQSTILKLALIVGAAILTLGPLPLHGQQAPWFAKGYTWGWTGRRGDYASREAVDSMRKLAETNADSVCISFAATVQKFDDPNIEWSDTAPDMVTDDEIRTAISLARKHNLRVVLKPVVNCRDSVWRAWIRYFRPTTDTETKAGIKGVENQWCAEPKFLVGQTKDLEKWKTFWKNYNAFLIHYAKIAEQENVEVFCVGCEMNSTEEFVDDWRNTIANVRSIYSGEVTYNAHHGQTDTVKFWDAVDFIGISAYYPVPTPQGTTLAEAIKSTTTVEEIQNELTKVRSQLRATSKRLNKPILFIECGLTNVRGCARYPWAFANANTDSPIDDLEQANYYQAMLTVFWDEPWFMGYMWWDWKAKLHTAEEASTKRTFGVHGRRGEALLKQWYARETPCPAGSDE